MKQSSHMLIEESYTSDPIIYTRDLTFCYGKEKVLEKLNLSVPKGSIYGFLGPNGAGKSTTIRILMGLLTVPDRSVFILGQDINQYRLQILNSVGNLIEAPSLYTHLTAWENLLLLQIMRKRDKKRIKEILELVGLGNVLHKKVSRFSMGMKQRLGIATALFSDPEIIILDEPINGLDPTGMQEMRLLFQQLHAQGKTIFYSSHLLSEVEKICTHLGIIHQGKLIYQDDMQAFAKWTTSRVRCKIDDIEKGKKLAQEAGINNVQVKQQRLLVEIPSEESFNKLIYIWVKGGLSIYSLEQESTTLEDLFIELINN